MTARLMLTASHRTLPARSTSGTLSHGRLIGRSKRDVSWHFRSLVRVFCSAEWRCNAQRALNVLQRRNMSTFHPYLICSFLSLLTLMPVHARLGESEAQSKARYGEPNPALIAATDKPLISGATELAYNFQGWRVRAAFVNGVTHRIEYVKIPEGGQVKPLTDAEVEAVLEAEKDKFRWREEKPRTGHQVLNELKEAFEGRRWERSDHADAVLKLKILLVLQSKDAEKLEKQISKTGKATPAPGGVPKF